MFRKKNTDNGRKGAKDPRERNPFRNAKLALGLTAALSLASCGETTNNYYTQGTDAGTCEAGDNITNIYYVQEPDAGPNDADRIQVTVVVENPGSDREVSELCLEEEVSHIAPSNEVTVREGESFVLPNGFRLELTDIESDSQTAFLKLWGEDGTLYRHIDLPEGEDVILHFDDPAERARYTLAACSVRAGYTYNERSATIRADVDLEKVTEPQPVEPACESGFDIQEDQHVYNTGLIFSNQYVQDSYCDGVLVRELSEFDLPIETEADASGGYGGLPPGRYTVKVFGEEFVLPDLDLSWMVLATESEGGEVLRGGALPVDEFFFRLDGLGAEGDGYAAFISVVDAIGTVLARFSINEGETKPIAVGEQSFNIHVYQVMPGYDEGEMWAHMAVFSEMREVREGVPYDSGHGDFSFSMDWGPGNTLRGWEFLRIE